MISLPDGCQEGKRCATLRLSHGMEVPRGVIVVLAQSEELRRMLTPLLHLRLSAKSRLGDLCGIYCTAGFSIVLSHNTTSRMF
jgi:hypothetical protein